MAELDYGDFAKKQALRDGMSAALKDAWIPINFPEDWDQYIKNLHLIDSHIRQRQSEMRMGCTPRAPTTPTVPAKPLLPVTERSTSTPGYDGPAPMGLWAAMKNAEHQRRFDDPDEASTAACDLMALEQGDKTVTPSHTEFQCLVRRLREGTGSARRNFRRAESCVDPDQPAGRLKSVHQESSARRLSDPSAPI